MEWINSAFLHLYFIKLMCVMDALLVLLFSLCDLIMMEPRSASSSGRKKIFSVRWRNIVCFPAKLMMQYLKLLTDFMH